MENKIERYVHEEFGELDIICEDEKFWFPATKCAEILGYRNTRDAVLRHCKGVVKHDMVTTRGVQQKSYIPEGDLYRLIIRSKLESAQRFEAWVFDTILPSIRKHGAFIMPELLDELQKNTEKNAELLKTLAAEQRKRIATENRNRELTKEVEDCKLVAVQFETTAKLLAETLEEVKPKVSYYDTILQNPEAVPVTLIAKDYGMPAVRFNRLLHDLHIQFAVGGTWELYQEYAGHGYTHGNVHYTRGGHLKMHTCWTQKGRLFLYEFLKENGILPKIEVAR